jgi:FMN reductase
VLVVATPVYNGSYSGLFKSFVDLLDPPSMVGRTVALGATGGSYRHSLVIDHALRPLFAFFQAAPVPTGVFATADDWDATGAPDATLAARIDRAAWETASLTPLTTRASA